MDGSISRSAILLCGPDVDLDGHSSTLSRLRIDSRPLSVEESVSSPVTTPRLYLLSVSWWNSLSRDEQLDMIGAVPQTFGVLLLAGTPAESIPPDLEASSIPLIWLDVPISMPGLSSALQAALREVQLRAGLADVERELEDRLRDLRKVHRVGVALSAEKDVDALHDLILRTSRQVTCADAGTLYLVEDDPIGGRRLVFHVSQNDSIDGAYKSQALPIDTSSVAGFVAATGQPLRIGDVYRLPDHVEYAFNPAFDRIFGYRTRSMLVVPMRGHNGDVVGVIQLINRKRRSDVRLTDAGVVERDVMPFSAEDGQLLLSFASQAAVALQNKMLLDSIQALFKGFVKAAVTAIESRDPSTFGHSERVAALTVGIAQAINRTHSGRWRDVAFSDEQIREIEYAALLHDFGKVGVREHMLVKAKKLYEWELQGIQSRFRLARQLVENHYLQRKLEYALAHGRHQYAALEEAIDRSRDDDLAKLDEALEAVLRINEPSNIEEERFGWLMQVASRAVLTADGTDLPLVTSEELRSLSIRHGSLDEDERKEIQSHVSHSVNFLHQIPWTGDLSRIPEIASAHHERLDGSGYPRGLRSEEIPLQAKIMMVADIYDALIAIDRPYRPADPPDRALDSLRDEALSGAIDADILDLFIEHEVYKLIAPAHRDVTGIPESSAVPAASVLPGM